MYIARYFNFLLHFHFSVSGSHLKTLEHKVRFISIGGRIANMNREQIRLKSGECVHFVSYFQF